MFRWANSATIMAVLALLHAGVSHAQTIGDGLDTSKFIETTDSGVWHFKPDMSRQELQFEWQTGLAVAPTTRDASASEVDGSSQAPPSAQQPELPEAPKPVNAATQEAGTQCRKPPCKDERMNWYRLFVNGPQVKPLTPKEKGWLALRSFVDPFNAITILGSAGIAVGSDSHSPYGPGMPGFGKYVGVSYTEDLTGEFFDTFLICSIAHQDPHYHRMPHASYVRRSLHAVSQVVWTQGDNERGMLNYANLVGLGIDDEIANLYVPGRETNARASSERYAIGLASAPITNFITEFLPDVANHIHVQVVIVQRIINQVANKATAGQ